MDHVVGNMTGKGHRFLSVGANCIRKDLGSAAAAVNQALRKWGLARGISVETRGLRISSRKHWIACKQACLLPLWYAADAPANYQSFSLAYRVTTIRRSLRLVAYVAGNRVHPSPGSIWG